MMTKVISTVKTASVVLVLIGSECTLAQSVLLDEVIVTADKIEQPASDVGGTVMTLTGDEMRSLGIDSARDLPAYTPGLSVSQSAATGVPIYTIRGVGFDDYSAAANPTVGIYYDEVSIPYPTMTRGIQYDLQRVEVLEGPQGDLYGKNTTGGAIKFISSKPTRFLESGIDLQYGTFDRKRVDAFVSGPLAKSVKARLAIAGLHEGKGWQRSILTGETQGREKKLGGRALVEWQPTYKTDVLFNLHFDRDRSENQIPQAFAYVPVVPGAGTVPTDIALIDASDPTSTSWSQSTRNGTQAIDFNRDNEGWGGYISIDSRLKNQIKFTSITAYESFKREEGNDWDGSDTRNLDVFNDTDIESVTQEFRLTSTGGAVNWIAGLFLSRDSVDERYLADILDASVSDFSFLSPGLRLQYVDTRYDIDTDSAAAYGHINWAVDHEWEFVLGGRYTYEKREITGACTFDVDGTLALLFGTSPGACVTVNPDTLESEVFNDDFTTNNLSGKVGINYTPDDDLLVFATISSGFKSGGYQGAAASTQEQWGPYGDETLVSAEFGVKSVLASRSMRINGALFQYWYNDKQVSDFIVDPTFGPLSFIRNINESRISGATLEWLWNPVRGFDLRLAGSYLDAKVEKGEGVDPVSFEAVDFSGKQLPNSPKWQVNALAAYQWPISSGMSMRAQTDLIYSDKYFSFLGNDPFLHRVNSYVVWNARLTLIPNGASWEIALFGHNIGNEAYSTATTFGNDIYSRFTARPRSVGLSFSYRYY